MPWTEPCLRAARVTAVRRRCQRSSRWGKAVGRRHCLSPGSRRARMTLDNGPLADWFIVSPTPTPGAHWTNVFSVWRNRNSEEQFQTYSTEQTQWSGRSLWSDPG